MYSNYNIPLNYRNMYQRRYPNQISSFRRTPPTQNRFGGFVVPFVLGGIAGYAINNNRPFYQPWPFFYPVYPTPYYPYYPYY